MYRMDHAYKRHRNWLPAGQALEDAVRIRAENIYPVSGRLGRVQDASLMNGTALCVGERLSAQRSAWPWCKRCSPSTAL
jgi:hypothetical protein